MFIPARRQRSGAAGGMQGTARLVGQTAGAVIMPMLFSLASLQSVPRIGLAVSPVLAVAGGLVKMLRVERGFASA
jgi:DHA2 family multidrug resistance protein-like MFS transporter